MRPSRDVLAVVTVLGVFGVFGGMSVLACRRERSEPTPPPAAAPDAKPATQAASGAVGDEPERLCGQKSLCPAEVVDQESATVCASLARDSVCGARFLALVKCQIAKEKCGADGKTDQVATLDLCQAEESALRDCEQAKAAAAQASAK